MKILLASVMCSLSLAAFASDSKAKTLSFKLKDGRTAEASYQVVYGSGDIVFEDPYLDQVTDLKISIPTPLAGEGFIATLSHSSHGGSNTYLTPGKTELSHAKFDCSAVTSCVAHLDNTTAGSVYNHGGDSDHILNRLTIVSSKRGIIYSAFISF